MAYFRLMKDTTRRILKAGQRRKRQLTVRACERDRSPEHRRKLAGVLREYGHEERRAIYLDG